MSEKELRVLQKESDELGVKLLKLSEFIGKAYKYKALNQNDKDLLVSQKFFMKRYCDILESRILNLSIGSSLK